MRSQLKPMHLFWLICLSNVAATLAVVILAVKSWHLPEGQHLPATTRSFGFAVIFLSLPISFAAEWLFQRRLPSGTSTDAMLARPRRYLSHPALTVFVVAMFLLAVLYFIVTPLRNSALGNLFLCLPLSLIRMSTVLRAKGTTTEFSSGSALYPAKPLQSDKWGI